MSVTRISDTAIQGDGASSAEPWESRTARFSVHRRPSAAVISAQGELDAANAAQLADYVERCTAYSARLILDLTKLEFIGTAGFSALHRINVRCAGAGVQWAVVPNHLVSRLLRICDPDHTLPTCDSVDEEPAANQELRLLLKLVAEPR
ncbi:MAG: STAS domain-containing protein [Mycobacterium sp.]|nr:STAS domain-containing protein [Mycobacterium sp.]